MLSSKNGDGSSAQRTERGASPARRDAVAEGAGRNAPKDGEFDDFPDALQDQDDDLPF
jgi:hypothetical protein